MTEIKKGTKSWKPAAYLPIKDAPKGYRAKWCLDEPANIERLEQEGWLHPHQVGQGTNVQRQDRATIEDGKNLTPNAKKFRELRLMYLPMEDFEARQEYIAQQNQNQVRGLKRHLKDQVSDGGGSKAATVYGKIVIE